MKDYVIDFVCFVVMVFVEDDEVYGFWKKILGFFDDKIICILMLDNFWFMGEMGFCGLCLEIFFDYGDKI